jgi:protein ImuB
MLWLALELPSLPLQVVERAGAVHEPLVIVEGPAQRPLVACANAAAEAAGIREGQGLAAAKALCATLRVVARDLQAERETLEHLAAWAGQFTPMVSVEAQGIALEVQASVTLFGGHAKLAAQVRSGVRALGLRAALGVAPTPLAARLFARASAQGLRARGCLSLAELEARLGELPLFLLDWPEKTLARLADLGILRVRDALALPPEGLARRFGPQIAEALARLTGRTADPRLPYAPPPRFRSRLELPAEAEGVEALAFPLARLLAELEGTLRGRGAGVQRLVLTLEHSRKASTRVALEFASPEREADFILAIAREKLARLALDAPTVALELRAEALLARASRETSWLPGEREQALDRERLVERLAARLGRERVFAIALAGDHRPERDWKRKSGTDPVFRDREHALRQSGNGVRPLFLLKRPRRLAMQETELELRAGPERIEAGWWDGGEVRRDYYIAANRRGECWWVFREHRDPHAWYLHGVFA